MLHSAGVDVPFLRGEIQGEELVVGAVFNIHAELTAPHSLGHVLVVLGPPHGESGRVEPGYETGESVVRAHLHLISGVDITDGGGWGGHKRDACTGCLKSL